jgi:hypothetical protein
MRCKHFIALIFLLSLVASSCSTERSILINSLKYDGSWFDYAKSIALKDGTRNGLLGYMWSSKTIYINAEKVYYIIYYTPSQRMKGAITNMVVLSKHYGSLSRTIFYEEDKNNYTLVDGDFLKAIASKNLTKEEAEELAYNFFKELDRYGLR